jgi:hypothetical protein
MDRRRVRIAALVEVTTAGLFVLPHRIPPRSPGMTMASQHAVRAYRAPTIRGPLLNFRSI